MQLESIAVDIETRSDRVTIRWADGSATAFGALWLRDNCPQDRDPASGQRLIDVADLPERCAIETAVLGREAVEVRFVDREAPVRYGLEWLARNAPSRPDLEHAFPRRLWADGSGLDARTEFAWIGFEAARDDAVRRLEWLTGLLRDGLAFMEGVPCRKGTILEVAALAGQVLPTNYGTTFDVRSVPAPENLAYSDLGLGLHTDNPYREPVPGFQALHVLQSAAEGGISLFADGFALAEELRATDPAAFECLTRTAVPFLYRAADVELYAERPLIELACDGAVAAVHYNNRSIAPLRGAAAAPAFYAAYRGFARRLRDERHPLRVQLEPGQLVLFDNQRTLHGRTAFTSARHARHLEGCYLTRDSVWSRAGVLRRAAAGAAAAAHLQPELPT